MLKALYLGSIMVRTLFLLFLFSSFASASEIDKCELDNSCVSNSAVSESIAKSLGWDEVLEYFDGFEFDTYELESGYYKTAYVAGFSNGSLTALLYISEVGGRLEVVSSLDVANYNKLTICNLNDDGNDDVCFTAYPKGTGVESYKAEYLQTKNGFILNEKI